MALALTLDDVVLTLDDVALLVDAEAAVTVPTPLRVGVPGNCGLVRLGRTGGLVDVASSVGLVQLGNASGLVRVET